jgi:hypothetical protein
MRQLFPEKSFIGVNSTLHVYEIFRFSAGRPEDSRARSPRKAFASLLARRAARRYFPCSSHVVTPPSIIPAIAARSITIYSGATIWVPSGVWPAKGSRNMVTECRLAAANAKTMSAIGMRKRYLKKLFICCGPWIRVLYRALLKDFSQVGKVRAAETNGSAGITEKRAGLLSWT